jgi:cardiolipin synthase
MQTIPNLITLLRIFLVPLTVWLIISEAYGAAFTSFLIAGASDGLDGFLARRFAWQTELGAYLDPLADKALLVSVYVTLGFMKVLPAWLVIIVVSRDVLIVGAIILSRVLDKPVRMAPLRVSKVNTAAQIVFVIAVLGVAALSEPLDRLVNYASIPVALLTLASGAAYLVAWLQHMGNGPPGETTP